MFGLDDKQDKRIANRIDWITQCMVILIRKLGVFLKIEFPPPPQE